MRFAIRGEHKRQLERDGSVEFEEVLETKHCDAAYEATLQLSQTRDLWRTVDLARRITLQRRLAEVAGELFNQRSLRIAFDQLLHPQAMPFHGESLQALSSVSGVVGGCIVRLSPSTQAAEALIQSCGNALYISVDWPIPPITEGCYLLIAYCKTISLYVANANDPYNHTLKVLGLGFGDRLYDQTHPFVLKP